MTWLEADADAEARYQELDAEPREPTSIPRLLAALHDESWRVRRLASERLGALQPTPEVVDQLVSLLGRRDDTGARNAAAAVLAQLGVAVVPAMVTHLRHPDPDQRKFAADILGALARPEGVPPLVSALEDGDANVRTAAAEALGRVGGPEARRALERLLGSADVMLRVCALEGLAALKVPPALPVLVPLLADPLTRRSAWRLLGHVAHPTATRLTVRALASREARDAALVSLGAAGRELSPEMEADLRVVLRPVADLHRWLEGALATAEDERRLGALAVARALGDASLALAIARSVREGRGAEAALATLVRFGLPGAHALLASTEALADLPGEARAVAADAIVRLAEPSLVPALVALVTSGEPELAELGARALGRTRARAAIAPLVALFEDDTLAVHAWRSLVALAQSWPDEVRAALDPLVQGRLRPHAVRAWGEILGPRAHDVLRRAQHDQAEAVRAAAAEASYFTPKDTVAALQAALMDESPLVRRSAARTIGRLQRPEGAPLAARALSDPDPTVLALACVATGELGHVELAERLKDLARHADAAVVVAALEGLALMGRLPEELLVRASLHADAEVLKLAYTLGADRALLVPRALSSLEHPRWDVRVAAARLLAVSGGREALGPLQDAEAREDDPVARELLERAVATLTGRL